MKHSFSRFLASELKLLPILIAAGFVLVGCGKKDSTEDSVETGKTNAQASVQLFEIVEPVESEESIPSETTVLASQPPIEEVTVDHLDGLMPLPANLSVAEKQQLLVSAQSDLLQPEVYQPEFDSEAAALLGDSTDGPVDVSVVESPEWQQVNQSVSELNQFLASSSSVASRADLDQLLSVYQLRRDQIDLSVLSGQEKVRAENLFFEGLDAAASNLSKQLSGQNEIDNELQTRLAQMMEGQL